MEDKWGNQLWECPAIDFRAVLRHDGWERWTLPQWPSMTKIRSIATQYSKNGKFHLVWSFDRRVPTKDFYQGLDVALREGGNPWDTQQPELAYNYAEWYAVSTNEEVSSCRFMSLFEFEL